MFLIHFRRRKTTRGVLACLLFVFVLSASFFSQPQDVRAEGVIDSVIDGVASIPGGVINTGRSASDAFTLDTGSCGWDIICGFEDIIISLGLFTGKIFAFFLQLAVKMTVWLIDQGTAMISSVPVKSGFAATLGLTNLIFVFAIIIIAFSTILRYENYSAKKMLPKLIIAAILVNFSMLIAGLILDISNVFTNYFLFGGVDANGIGGALNPAQFLAGGQEVPLSDISLSQFINILFGIFIAVIMTAFMTVIMFWVGVTVLVRNIWISLLLMVMPLIWGFWVLPTFQEHWSKWWKRFIEWSIYLPSITFFLWLAVKVSRTPEFSSSFNGITFATAQNQLINGNIFEIIIRALIVLGLIIGGMKTGKAFGIVGAAFALTAAGFAAKFGMKAASKVLGSTITAPLSVPAATVGALVGKQGQRFANAKNLGSKFFGVGRSIKTSVGFLADKTATTTQVPTGEVIDALGTNRMKDERKDNKFFGGARKFVEGFGKMNLYGKAAELVSQQLANYPMLAPIAQFLGRMSSSQRADAEDELKKADGLSKEGKKNLIAGLLKGGATGMLAAALLADKEHLHSELPHDPEGLKKLVDTIAALNPGAERKDIEILKKIAMHNPDHAEAVTGQSRKDIINSASADAIRSWSKDTYQAIKDDMGASVRKTWASKNNEARSIVFGEEVDKFASAVEKLDKETQTKFSIDADLIKKLKDVASGKADRGVVSEVEGLMESFGDNKEFKAALDGAGKNALSLANEVQRVSISTKTDSGHSEHPSADYQLSTMLIKFLKNASPSGGGGKSGGGGGGGHASGHGGGGHGH